MKDRIYIAKSGDTWDSISFKFYEDEFKIELLFGGGEKINIPDLPESENISLPDWRR